MSVVINFFKIFVKLFPVLIIAMLGVGHSVVELTALNNHTNVSIFRFTYEPTFWTVFVTLFLTLAALLVAIKVILNFGKSYKKDS